MSNDTVDAAFNSEGSIDPAIETPTALGSTMPTDVYRLTNFQSSTGLDFNGQENPVGVVCSTSNPNACSQYWRIIPGIVRGYYLIQNVATNAAVEAVGRNQQCLLSPANTKNPAQSWAFVSDGGNPAHFKLTNYKFKNLVLDLDHGYSGNDVTVFSFDDNNGDNQRWEAAPLQADGDSISGAAAAMVAQWQLKCPQMSNIYNSDAEYAYGDLHELQAIWMKSYLNPRNPDHVTYKKDVFDCDDFALAMKAAVAKQCYADLGAMACSIGIVWTYDSVKHSGHAFNVFLDKLWQVKLFEPQTGQLYYMTPSEKTLFVMF